MDASLRERALALGYNEAVSLTFISHADAEEFSSATVLELENPLSEEASCDADFDGSGDAGHAGMESES